MVGNKTSASKKKANPAAKTSSRPPSSRQTPSPAHHDDAVQSPTEQQIVLNIFSDAFAAVLASDRFPTLLREIKQALYGRDFGTAFGKEEYLETYAARWSPTRALCYASIFLAIHQHTAGIMGADRAAGPEQSTGAPSTSSEQLSASDQESGQQGEPLDLKPQARLRMLCIGGCAAEHVAFASHLRRTSRRGTLMLLDAGPWTHVAARLQHSVTTAPPLSKYASASARAANRPLLGTNQLEFAFAQADALDLAEDRLAEVVGVQPQIVTLLFTLNELYAEAGIGKTTRFLTALGRVLPAESLLLVVDSPGSYSEAAVGKEKKKYPMQWLLNHTLLRSETNPAYTWESLESHDSIWFRRPEGLTYPIRLEDMRYQMHLYRLHKNSIDAK